MSKYIANITNLRIIAQIQIIANVRLETTRLLGQRYDVYSKYHKVGNSFNLLKYTHKNTPVVYQKQTKNGFKNNININKDNFTNLLATFFVKVQQSPQMNEIFQYFADVLLVTMRDALILLLDKFLKVKLGCSLALAISVVCKELREPMNSQVLLLKICPVVAKIKEYKMANSRQFLSPCFSLRMRQPLVRQCYCAILPFKKLFLPKFWLS